MTTEHTKKKLYFQDIAILIIIVFVSTCMLLFLTVFQNGWRHKGETITYLHYGKPLTGMVTLYEENVSAGNPSTDVPLTYLFGEDGQMRTGWVSFEGNLYYQDCNRGILTGEQSIDGEEYYFETDGRLVAGVYEDTHGIYRLHDEHGKPQTGFVTIEGNTYYANEEGQVQFGWQELDGKIYYFHPETAVMATGFLTLEDGTYYFDENGRRKNGFLRAEDGIRYFGFDGRLVLEPFSYRGKSYRPTEDGTLYQGFWTENGKEYYYSAVDGSLFCGWMHSVDGFQYYGEDGSRVSGWTTIEDSVYYFDPEKEDSMLTGWQQLDGNDYYFGELGMMSTGLTTIDGSTYYFYENGALARSTKVGNYNIDENGIATNPYEVITPDNLDSYIEILLDTYGRDLYSIYHYCLSNFTYRYRAKSDVDSMACRILNNGNGACWDYAALCYKMMTAAGYNCQIVVGCGAVASEHNWVIVEVSPGVWRHYDPERRGLPIYNLTDDQIAAYDGYSDTVRYQWNRSAYPEAK